MTAVVHANRFEVTVVDLGARKPPKWWSGTEDDAVALAREALCRQSPHVSIVAWSPEPKTWAIRHLTWDDEAEGGPVVDSGWRCWVADEFAGAGVVA